MVETSAKNEKRIWNPLLGNIRSILPWIQASNGFCRRKFHGSGQAAYHMPHHTNNIANRKGYQPIDFQRILC